MSEETTQEIIGKLRVAAMNALGRREHSSHELKQKLQQRFKEASLDEIDQVLGRLQSQNLQSDERFTEMFVRSRINRGKGPSLIRQELQQHALPSGSVNSAIEGLQEDWKALAIAQLEKKYNPTDMQDYAMQIKAKQFLYRRGFESDVCSTALESFKRIENE